MRADLTPEDSAALRGAVKCRCGHPRGDHAVKRPHACTEYAERLSWYCPCNKFEAVESGWDRLLDRIESDRQRIAELEAENERLLEMRERVANWVSDLSYQSRTDGPNPDSIGRAIANEVYQLVAEPGHG